MLCLSYDVAGQLDKLKVDQCKLYLRKHGLRLTGKKDILIHRIKEHLEYDLYPLFLYFVVLVFCAYLYFSEFPRLSLDSFFNYYPSLLVLLMEVEKQSTRHQVLPSTVKVYCILYILNF